MRSAITTFACWLVIATFLEDTLRIIVSFEQQQRFVHGVTGMPPSAAAVGLVASAIVQSLSIALVLPHDFVSAGRVKLICGLLIAFVPSQPVFFGQLHDLRFICLSIAHAGALALIFCSAHARQCVENGSSTPDAHISYRGAWGEAKGWVAWMQLMGRLLLTMDILAFSCHQLSRATRWTWIGFNVAMVVGSILVWFGVHVEPISVFLALTVATEVPMCYPFWRVRPEFRDNFRFFFFQTLGMVGGLLLLALHGPGRLHLPVKRGGSKTR